MRYPIADRLAQLPWDAQTWDVALRRLDRETDTPCQRSIPYRIVTNVDRLIIWHSPDGFEWGFGGSGPADLALNILHRFLPPGVDGHQLVACYEGACSDLVARMHQQFKSQVIAPLPDEGGLIEGVEIVSWIYTHLPPGETLAHWWLVNLERHLNHVERLGPEEN